MKQKVKKLSTTRKWAVAAASIAIVAAIWVFLYISAVHEPSWKYVQSFDNDRLLTSVDWVSVQHKKSTETFFLIHGFDTKTNAFIEPVKIPLDEETATQSEYVGFSKKYVWLKTPRMLAVRMDSPVKKVLSYTDLCKAIQQKNPALFQEVISLDVVEDYLVAENQDGDQFHISTETFAAQKESPIPRYEYHEEFTIVPQLPLSIQENNASPGTTYSFCEKDWCYMLHPANDNNPVQRSFFRTKADKPQEITVVASDSTQVLIMNGSEEVSVSNAVPFEPLSSKTFINAVGIGLRDNAFVFYYQKKNTPASPWFLAWFDLESKSICKEIDLSKKGLNYEQPADVLTHRVSVKGTSVFFFIGNRNPVKIAL